MPSLGIKLEVGRSATSSGRLPGGSFSNEYSLSFDGTDSYVKVASNPNLDVYTCSLWFKSAETYFSLPIAGFGKSGEPTGGIRFVPVVTGRAIEFHDGSQYIAAGGLSNSEVFDNAWHHVAIVFVASGYETTTEIASNNGIGYKIFFDGERVDTALGSTSYNYALSTTSSVFAVGKERTSWYEGLIDEVAVFGSSLSDADISSISGAPTDLTDYNPTFWWRMGEDATWDGTDWTIPDASGEGNAGTTDNMVEADRVTDVPS